MLEAFIDAPQLRDQLTVFPVVAPKGPVLPYLLSPDILDAGVLTVREHADGDTPVLLARNNSLHALLVLSGEPFPGGSPGRLVERSILLGGKSITQIPASSTESGGWVRPDLEAEITAWLESFPLLRQQVGVLAFLGDRLLGLETLGSPNLFAPVHRRILIRFIKRALTDGHQDSEAPAPLDGQAQRVVDAIEVAERIPTKRVGLGLYWSLAGSVSGGELIHEGHLVHLSVRPVPAESPTGLQR
jgi:hypothetical protein